MSEQQRRALSEYWQGPVNWDAAMAEYCTFRAGGKADALVTVGTLQELSELVQVLNRNEIPWRVIGRGSNILVSDRGFGGVLILLAGEFSQVEQSGGVDDESGMAEVKAGAGCSVSKLVSWCTQNSLAGLEFMAGIPGTVGGAVFMNAGAWGKEIGTCLKSVTYVDRTGSCHELAAEEITFSYRKMEPRNTILNDAIIVGVTLLVSSGRQREIVEECRRNLARRNETQPTGMASAGSFFKNPEGDSAGRLIDAAGLKGLRRGEAMVSPKHANFIVNTGHASADDIIELMKEVRQKVYDATGILLEPEVQLL